MKVLENQDELITQEINQLSKKDYFAIHILNGLVGKYTLKSPEDQQILAQMSVELAETLLTELNKYDNEKD